MQTLDQSIQRIKKLNACSAAIFWLESLPPNLTLDQAWQQCARHDWMLWLLGRTCGGPRSKSRRQLVMVACAFARLALPYVPKSEKRPLKAILLAEKWARGGKVTRQQLANAAAEAANAAANAAAEAARDKTLAKIVGIIRKHFPRAPKIK